MKSLFSLLLFLLTATCLSAQTFQTSLPQRRIQFRTIGKDSINLNLNDEYDMIEDSCAQIIRHGHLNMGERKFVGKFQDVSKLDPSVVVSEGTYTNDGLKTGLFISHYLNGNLRSKGSYKNDKYDGKWETYYEDAKPALIFEVVNDTTSIIDAWDAGGKKTIDNGKGSYQVNLGSVSWKGKLVNGRPDGTWSAFKTDDATQTNLVEESFKKGKFQKGNTSMKKYTDVSRVVLINPETFVFTRAEKLRISMVPCNGTKRKHVVNAQYNNGLSSFSMYISDLVKPVISTYNIVAYKDDLTLDGDISEKGTITSLKAHNTFNESLARGIIIALRNLPVLNPAMVDGKAVKQQFTITFTFLNGMYSFTYKFLPVKAE